MASFHSPNIKWRLYIAHRQCECEFFYVFLYWPAADWRSVMGALRFSPYGSWDGLPPDPDKDGWK